MKVANKIDSFAILRPGIGMNLSENGLLHYGVKGMKWGIRRTKEELKYNKSSVVATVNRKGIKVQIGGKTLTCRMSDHAGDQAASRNVSKKDIIDAISKPLHTGNIVYDSKNRSSQRFIGKRATININPNDGTICTLWRTGERTSRKYMNGE